MTFSDTAAPVDAKGDDAAAPSSSGSREQRASPDDLLLGELEGIRAHLATLVAETKRSADHARAREQVIVRQGDELDALRAERRGSHLRPLVVGLQKLRAELLASARDPAPGAQLRGLFEYYADSVEAILERCGVAALPVSPGDEFDPARHVLVRTRACTEHEHRTVLEVLAEGWTEREAGRVLAPAKVVVGRRGTAENRTDDETTTQEHTDV
ncbi:nucleotide exchange factor GrpE [Actinomycetospora atypica]|uniref:Nucleotide exchange factor GrpE n=1 Tax=Actinomycetospora atypica TaxID=1290095 RepID=A0ABV9YQA6_9PSEU